MHSADQTKQIRSVFLTCSALVSWLCYICIKFRSWNGKSVSHLKGDRQRKPLLFLNLRIIDLFCRQFYDTSDTNFSLSLRQQMRRFIAIGVLQSINLPKCHRRRQHLSMNPKRLELTKLCVRI